jgi:1-acyl-sn-glycerol-3-phosphate acyltransferase
VTLGLEGLATDTTYDEALAAGRLLYPGARIGRPGRARTYRVTTAALRTLRLRWDVELEGADQVGPGGAILVGNHLSTLDPLVVVMSTWWRVTAFTKVEFFESPGAVFFRLMGQIPLRRGDEASTRWALDMAARTLAGGGKLGLYPEGTRSPDPGTLHRLHKRVLVPVLQCSPDTPVHAVTTSYTPRRFRRTQVRVRVSPPLALDARAMSADELTDRVRDALLELGGQTYVHEYARDVKKTRATPPSDPGAPS